jgi:hypothetical protein
MEIEFDPDKEAFNLLKHNGVSLKEGATVLLDSLALVDEDKDNDEQRFVGLGMSEKGRLLVVVWTMRGEVVRPISARKATKKEAEAYEK